MFDLTTNREICREFSNPREWPLVQAIERPPFWRYLESLGASNHWKLRELTMFHGLESANCQFENAGIFP
jgi:hypothetical protein